MIGEPDTASWMDIDLMGEAINLAKQAAAAGDVPIGCVITHGEEIIARAYNRRNQDASVLAHAEIIAIDQASKNFHDFRLEDCTLCHSGTLSNVCGRDCPGTYPPRCDRHNESESWMRGFHPKYFADSAL